MRIVLICSHTGGLIEDMAAISKLMAAAEKIESVEQIYCESEGVGSYPKNGLELNEIV